MKKIFLMFFLFFSFSTVFAETVRKSDIQSLNYELKLIEERNRQTEEKTKIQTDALRNELLLKIENLENRIDLYKWVVAILFTLITFFGFKTVLKWIRFTIEDKTEQELKKRITDEYIAKIIKERGEAAINSLISDLENEAKKVFSNIEMTREEYVKAFQKIETIKDINVSSEHAEDLRKFVENLVQAKTEEMYSFEDWMFKGYNDYTKNDFMSALRSLTKALQINPNNAEAYHNRGLAYARLKEYEQALKEFDMAISLKPDFQAAYVDKGTTFLRLGKIKEAIESYEQAKQFKGSIILFAGLAEAYIFEGDFEKAFLNNQKAMELSKQEEHIIISLYLDCIIKKLSNKKIDNEDKLQGYLQPNLKIEWSFEEMEKWLRVAMITDEQKKYIADLTETLKEYKN